MSYGVATRLGIVGAGTPHQRPWEGARWLYALTWTYVCSTCASLNSPWIAGAHGRVAAGKAGQANGSCIESFTPCDWACSGAPKTPETKAGAAEG